MSAKLLTLRAPFVGVTCDDPRGAPNPVRHRPPLCSLLGAEERLHFPVEYPSDESFRLVEVSDRLDQLVASGSSVDQPRSIGDLGHSMGCCRSGPADDAQPRAPNPFVMVLVEPH